jgi:hypothetical protein
MTCDACRSPLRKLLGVMLCGVLAACTTNGARIDRRAGALGLERSVVTGTPYHHIIYANALAQRIRGDEPLAIFLEGDGRPWGRPGLEGLAPATDPTTGRPLALELLGRTPMAAAYITRPCYHQLDPERCNSSAWTMERYAAPMVESLASAINTYAARHGAPSLLLIGYSGGGTLAVLLAERLSRVAGVITIGANLDVPAWTQHHRYLPLSGSLNPAASTARHPWPELHLQGGQDEAVPAWTTNQYFTLYPQAQRWELPSYDHVCCWREDWPQLLSQARARLAASSSSLP